MIPQGYALQIQDIEGKRYMVVGWHDYGQTARPVVVPIDGTAARAVMLPEDVEWKVRTWA